jgi:hypothetical protein
MVLIWGVQQNQNKIMVDRTKRYIEYLEEENEKMLPQQNLWVISGSGRSPSV